MIIYGILDDIRLLTRFDNNELKENVVNYARKILNQVKNASLNN